MASKNTMVTRTRGDRVFEASHDRIFGHILIEHNIMLALVLASICDHRASQKVMLQALQTRPLDVLKCGLRIFHG
jgi:hypothetical protein